MSAPTSRPAREDRPTRARRGPRQPRRETSAYVDTSPRRRAEHRAAVALIAEAARRRRDQIGEVN
ncbi:hypothetical protein GCM10022215_18370 [Nocardioides fonticola]|uniref:Uncharacterized protein n=1 Tax=Nocardioides fonticola TaxID=450363 RepID=A0ABP7XJA7_9ACTN